MGSNVPSLFYWSTVHMCSRLFGSFKHSPRHTIVIVTEHYNYWWQQSWLILLNTQIIHLTEHKLLISLLLILRTKLTITVVPEEYKKQQQGALLGGKVKNDIVTLSYHTSICEWNKFLTLEINFTIVANVAYGNPLSVGKNRGFSKTCLIIS